MNHQIELIGKSGAIYRYRSLQADRSPPPTGANYILAQLKPDGTNVVFAGETENLAAMTWSAHLDRARGRYGEDTEILTRLNVAWAVRQAEQEDLVEEYKPVMNRARVS